MNHIGHKIDCLKKIWTSARPDRGTFGGLYTGKISPIILAYREGSNHVVGK
jgi:hypothetical protein